MFKGDGRGRRNGLSGVGKRLKRTIQLQKDTSARVSGRERKVRKPLWRVSLRSGIRATRLLHTAFGADVFRKKKKIGAYHVGETLEGPNRWDVWGRRWLGSPPRIRRSKGAGTPSLRT